MYHEFKRFLFFFRFTELTTTFDTNPMTFMLNDDVLLYIINFFEFKGLFGVIAMVNKKFKQLSLRLESNRLNRKFYY